MIPFLRGAAAGLFFALLVGAPARADWIDVKGEGAMNGEIVEETADAIQFRDGEGKVRSFRRDQIVFMEKEAAKPRSSATPKSLFSGEKKDKSSLRASGGSVDKFAIKPLLGDDSPLKPVENAVAEGGKVFQGYIYYDTDFVNYLQNSAKRLEKYKDSKQFAANNNLLAGLGALMMIGGLIGLIIHGFKLMMKMFETGFFWGLVFLANAANAYLSRMIGGPAGLFLATVPPALSFLFVILHWPVARRAVTMQCYSLAVLLGGWYLLSISML